MKNLLTLTLLALLSTTITVAQNTDSSERRLYRAKKSYHVFFDINRSVVDWSYKSNEHTLTQIKSDCDSSFRNGMPAPDTVFIHSTSSPDGPEAFNSELAYQRALATKTSILNLIPEFKNSHFVIKHQVENWDALRQILLSDESFPQKEQMLKTLSDSTQAGNLHMALKQHSEGWEYYVQNHLYSLRNSAVSLSILTSRPQDEYTVTVEDYQPAAKVGLMTEITGIKPDTTTSIVISDVPKEESCTRKLYIKTNAIGLGMGIANVAMEIDIEQHWSFTLPVYYSAWDYFKTTIKFRTFSVQPELRYWLSESNDGFFAGIHFGLSYYNFAFNGDYRYQDHNRETPSIGGGVNAGYRMPIGNNNRWRVEFSLGAGAYSRHYDKFHNTPSTKDGLMIEDIKKTYWGIDQAAVSFSYSFDLKKKGDKR